MRLPNGYGSIVKMSGKRRRPYAARKTVGWRYDKKTDRQVQEYAIGESGYTNQCAMFAQIKNARSHLDVANISISRVQNEDRKPLSDALADL